MRLIRRSLILPAVLLVAVAAALPAGARPHGVAKTSVTVTMKEFKFTFSKSTVPHGPVVFTLVNKGKLSHDLKIAGKKSPLIKPGKKGTFIVTLAKSGRYPYVCTVKGHAAAGMKGVLKVS